MNVAKIEINSSKFFWISGIDFVVNLSDYDTPPNILKIYGKTSIEKVLRYNLDDKYFNRTEYSSIKHAFETLYKKLGQRILVHCTAGINRSATFIAYSILRDTYLSPNDVITIIKKSNLKWRNTDAIINPTLIENDSK